MNARLSLSILSRFTLACGLVLFLCTAHPLAAQSQDPQPAQTPSAPSTPGEGFKFGLYEGHSDIEVGYRWVSDIGGNSDMYRSMINLGEGPKLLRSNISLRSKSGTGLFDTLDMSMNSWGGDPYNTFHLSLGRTDVYDFRADYRNYSYYNFIPTYANPLLTRGNLFGQHSLDTSYRSTDLELKLFPNSKVRPYVAYSRSSSFGPGFTTYRVDGNEFLLNSNWQYASDEYRGGVELSLPRLVLTLEQGYQLLRNDSGVTNSSNKTGNTPVPFLGQTITVNSLNRGYHDRTSLPITKVLAKFTPLNELKITGRYIYSMTDLESTMGEAAQGNFISLDNRIIYQAALDAFNGKTKRPNHNGSFQVEFTPLSRLTISNEVETRNFHISGSALLASVFYNVTPLSGPPTSNSVAVSNLLNSSIAYDQTRVQTEVEVDLGAGFAARAGHRYTSFDTALSDTQNGITDLRSASAAQQSGLAGIVFRRGRWVHLAFSYEKNSTDHAITRTDLLDYDQFKFDWRLNLSKKFSASGRLAFLRNTNPQSDIDFHSHNRNYTVALSYNPNQRFSLSLDFSRSNIYSDIAIIIPQALSLDRSIFDERGDAVGSSLGIAIYRGSRIDFGYRAIFNVGNFPLNYHQPFAAISIPLHNHIAFKTYWQYFGYNEKSSSLQDYRSHLVTYSLAFSY